MEPFGTVPANPILFKKKIHILLHITTMAAVEPPPLHPQLLASCLTTPLADWESPLWHNIWPHAHMDYLWQAIIKCQLI